MKQQKLPIDPNVELFRWGPIPGRVYYQSDALPVLFGYMQKLYHEEFWPKALMLYSDTQMIWLNEFSELRVAGQKAFLQYMLPEATREELYAKWKEQVAHLEQFEQTLESTDITARSDQEFVEKGREFFQLILDFWAPTFIQESANYAADDYLEEKLRVIIPTESARAKAMEILTAPEVLSFFQQEEIELSEADDIEKHRQKYFWIKNSYAGTQVLPAEFFLERKKVLGAHLYREMDEMIQETKKKKLDLQKKHDLPDEIMAIARALCIGMEWQDERKKYLFILQHYKDIFRFEMARRKQCDAEKILNWGLDESLALFSEIDFAARIQERSGFLGFYGEGDSFHQLTREEANNYWGIYAKEKYIGDEVNELKGIIASRGKGFAVQGKVRIVLDPSHIHDFQEKDILVAPMTSPDYIFLMKQSAAIVTDTGGLTSHAAIVSRELGVPCIVGTKIATQVLHDGDLVEVDADNGTVRILERVGK